MPVCVKCKTRNDPGHVFCVHCGARLDLSRLDRHDFRTAHPRRGFYVSPGKAAGLLAAALIAVLAGLAAWPMGEPLGNSPDEEHARRVADALKVLQLSRGMQRIGRDFTEDDLNSYFAVIRSPNLGLMSFSCRLRENRIRLREEVVQTLNLGEHSVSFRTTRDVVLEPEGDTVRVTGGRVGHLPLPAGLAGWVARGMRERFEGEREMLILDRLEHIEAGRGRVMIEVGP